MSFGTTNESSRTVRWRWRHRARIGAGWPHDVALCEIDPRAQAVLNHRFPRVRIEPDVSAIARLPRDIDLLTAGFPCQDLSQAGKTSGIFGRRSGLIRSVFRLISDSEPPWVLIENVPFLLRLDGGRGIAYVTRNLERLGYRWAYRIVDTRAFGLPHRRERVFLLASRVGDPASCLLAKIGQRPIPKRRRCRAWLLLDRGHTRVGVGSRLGTHDQGGIRDRHSFSPGNLVPGWAIRHPGYSRCRASTGIPSQLDSTCGESR